MTKIFPIFIPHQGCPFDCIYCNQYKITKVEHPDFELLKLQINNFITKNKNLEKQIAFFGGTFTALPSAVMQKYLDFANQFKNISIRISTRPDCINQKVLEILKENNVKTIELGVQSFCDEVLIASQRGYSSKVVETSCSLIKENNFALGIQLMPGLPKDDESKFFYTVNKTIESKADFVRIYPTLVLKNTKLEELFLEKKFNPIDLDTAIEWSAKALLKFTDNKINVIKIGLHSDINVNKSDLISGPFHPNFGEFVKANYLILKILSSDSNYNKIIFSDKDKSLFLGNGKKMLHFLKFKLKKEDINIDFELNLSSTEYLLLEE